MDYEDAAQLMKLHVRNVRLGTGIVSTHNHLRKKLKYKTTLRKTGEVKPNDLGDIGERHNVYILRYFNTDIITYHHNHIELNDGGFFSRSTHDRFNEYMPRGFSVSGTTYPELGLRRPLGFLKTPCGVYPYRNRMWFTYAGEPYGYTDPPYFATQRAVEALPGYVDRYLDTLFSRGECSVNNSREADNWWMKTRSLMRTNAGRAVVDDITFRFLVLLVGRTNVIDEPPRSMADGLQMADLGLMLAHGGVAMFKKPRTNAELAQRLEYVLDYGRGIPNINRQSLRVYLRKQLFVFIIDRLGFSAVEWNRRAR